MKLADLKNPVRFNWLADQGLRLAASPYLSGAYEAKKLLEQLPGTQPLHELTAGHDGGIYNGPQFRRNYVTDPDHGVPFLGSVDMLEADLTNTPVAASKGCQVEQACLPRGRAGNDAHIVCGASARSSVLCPA